MSLGLRLYHHRSPKWILMKRFYGQSMNGTLGSPGGTVVSGTKGRTMFNISLSTMLRLVLRKKGMGLPQETIRW